MSTNHLDTRHIDEEELVQLLDDELPPELRLDVISHVFGCKECSERMQTMVDASGWLSGYFAALDSEVEVDELARARALSAMQRAAARTKGARTPWLPAPFWRAAAVVALVLFGGLTVPPLRAWVADLVSPSAANIEIVPARAEAETAAAPGAPTVSFRPVGATFLIELAHPQESGSITLHSSQRDLASAQIFDHGEETLLILPAGVRIENSALSGASYRVEVPDGMVSQVRIVVGGRILADLVPPPVGSPLPIDLAGEAAR